MLYTRIKYASFLSVSRGYNNNVKLSFSLDPRKLPEGGLKHDHWETIKALFPTTRSVSLTILGLVIYVDEIPPRPHPVTVADAPVFFTMDDKDVTGWNNWAPDKPGRGDDALKDQDFKGLASLDMDTCEIIGQHCAKQNIYLYSIQLVFGPAFICNVKYSIGQEKVLPASFGGVPCYWRLMIEPKNEDGHNKSCDTIATETRTVEPQTVEINHNRGEGIPRWPDCSTLRVARLCTRVFSTHLSPEDQRLLRRHWKRKLRMTSQSYPWWIRNEVWFQSLDETPKFILTPFCGKGYVYGVKLAQEKTLYNSRYRNISSKKYYWVNQDWYSFSDSIDEGPGCNHAGVQRLEVFVSNGVENGRAELEDGHGSISEAFKKLAMRCTGSSRL